LEASRLPSRPEWQNIGITRWVYETSGLDHATYLGFRPGGADQKDQFDIAQSADDCRNVSARMRSSGSMPRIRIDSQVSVLPSNIRVRKSISGAKKASLTSPSLLIFYYFLFHFRAPQTHIDCRDRLLLYRMPPADFVNDVHIKHSRYPRLKSRMVTY
jgi:hypothetical protein